MKKVQAVSIPAFIAHGFPPVENRLLSHLKRNQNAYVAISSAVVGTVILADITAFASGTTGAAGLDVNAHKIYHKICNIGKWVIVIRGAVDIIGSMSEGDLDRMKKKVIQYVVGYVALLGLPWLLDQASGLFDDPEMQ